MADETYTAERIRGMAVNLERGWQFVGLALKRGETAWNPASTKGPLYGPSLVEYHMHLSGIEVHEKDLTVECQGGDRLKEWPFWRACQDEREAGTTRCAKHTPGNPTSA